MPFRNREKQGGEPDSPAKTGLWAKLNQPVSLKPKGDGDAKADRKAAKDAAKEAKKAEKKAGVWAKLNQPVSVKPRREKTVEEEPAPAPVAVPVPEPAPEPVAVAAAPEIVAEPAVVAEPPVEEDLDLGVEWLSPPPAEPEIEPDHDHDAVAAPTHSDEIPAYEPPSLMDLVPTRSRVEEPAPAPVADPEPVPVPMPAADPEPEPEPDLPPAAEKPKRAKRAKRERTPRSKPSLKSLATLEIGKPSFKRPGRKRRDRPVIGLDIEPGAVRVVQARLEGGRLKVEKAVSAELDTGIVRDGEVVLAEDLGRVLRDLFAEHKLDKRVRIGVANQRIVVRELIVPPIDDPKQLATAVTFLAADELPMPIDQAVIDHIVIGPVDTPEGPRIKVLLVAARRSMIDTLLSATRHAGLKPEGIDLAAFAMLRALGPSTGGVLHLNVGGVVNLAVMNDDECVFTRVVAGGIESMAVELAERHTIEVHEAREALHAASLVPAGRADDSLAADARLVLETGLRRIAGEVRNSLDFLFSGDGGGMTAPAGDPDASVQAPAVERVVLSGPAIAIAGFAEALGERLALPIEIADVDGVDEDQRGLYAIAAGLTVAEVPV